MKKEITVKFEIDPNEENVLHVIQQIANVTYCPVEWEIGNTTGRTTDNHNETPSINMENIEKDEYLIINKDGSFYLCGYSHKIDILVMNRIMLNNETVSSIVPIDLTPDNSKYVIKLKNDFEVYGTMDKMYYSEGEYLLSLKDSPMYPEEDFINIPIDHISKIYLWGE